MPALRYNRYAWSKFSNMVYLESPVGVGFSYCEHPPCASNDTRPVQPEPFLSRLGLRGAHS